MCLTSKRSRLLSIHRNICSWLITLYNFVLSLIFTNYEPRNKDGSNTTATVLQNTSKIKFDSRLVSPPSFHSKTESAIFLSNQKQIATCDKINFVFPYSDKNVHATIYWFKYKRDTYTIKLLARILWDTILWEMSEKIDSRQIIKKWIISTAPSTNYNNGSKDWDHNQDLLLEMENIFKIQSDDLPIHMVFEFVQIFCVNPQYTINKSNKDLHKNERIHFSKNKFVISDKFKNPKTITSPFGLVIVDDVTTTGSTLLNLEKLSHQNLNPQIILSIAIAH